jgi:fission process protein 1
MVAFGYCLADATTSGYRAYNNSTIKTDASDDARAVVDATVASVDTLLWQSMASVAIPGFVIHQIVKWSRFGIQKIASASISPHKHRPRIMMMTTWGPTMLGLASIPLIIKPIDMFVDEVMENTFRTYVIPDNNSSCNNSSGGNKEN